MTKFTRHQYFTAIINYIEKGIPTVTINDQEVEIDNDDMIKFCAKEQLAIEKKAAKARETAQKKKSENDVLTQTILSLLTSELRSSAEITEEINNPTVTKSKVTYRLTKLVENGFAEKEEVKIDKTEDRKSHKIMCYRLKFQEQENN